MLPILQDELLNAISWKSVKKKAEVVLSAKHLRKTWWAIVDKSAYIYDDQYL